ncbi:hypothetical protein SAMN05444354_1046 [Stigmatella aurantiaca]|uniref:Uncharacterized protein n=1 Tax=Stigmatella aurantiaca TaxID=41 RepID=A0A1H7MJB3_STIAU|nr:hypothetical protein [Stigmatella aurantiaca]SEL11201.1 hypothetical protein SAMN05444354_1046 [Stigmatella aurantiaca]
MSTPKELDLAEATARHEAKLEEQRKAVRRQVRAGLSDPEIARVLRMGKATVTKLRTELGLPKNSGRRECAASR